jgi:hypothetical protein
LTTPPSLPISQANPQSLQRLFNTNPADMTDAEAEQVVQALLEMKKKWIEEEKAPKAKKQAADPNIAFGDLDI